MPRLRFVPLVCAIGCAAAFPTGTTAAVTHDGSGTILVTDPPSLSMPAATSVFRVLLLAMVELRTVSVPSL